MSLSGFSLFEQKLNDVIEVMLNNSLRKDLDDTLLEKLLSAIREKLSGEKNSDAVSDLKKSAVELFESSKFPLLFDAVLSSLAEGEIKFDVCIISFAINSFGLFAEHEEMFQCLVSNKMLNEFLKVCIKNSSIPFKPSIHAALLAAITCFTKHAAGLGWLISKGILDITMASFAGSSYYVRKDAAKFFVSAFSEGQLLYSDSVCEIRLALESCVQRIVSLLVRSLSSAEYALVQESCIAILYDCIKNSEDLLRLFCEKFQLGQKLCEFWMTSAATITPSESLIDIIVESCLYYQNQLNDKEIIADITQTFLKKKMVLAVISLNGKLLKKQQGQAEVSVNDIATILWPLLLATNWTTSCHVSPAYDEVLRNEMNCKILCVSAIRLSLTTLSQFVSSVDIEALAVVTEACQRLLLFPGVESSQFSFLADNPKIKALTLKLLNIIVRNEKSANLPEEVKVCLLKCLLELIGRPSNDFKFTSQALLLLGECNYVWTSELVDKFSNIFQRKLLDKDWAVVDSALVAAVLLLKCSNGLNNWYDFMRSDNILSIVVDLAFAGEAEGYVRASAVRFITSLWLSSLTVEPQCHLLNNLVEGTFVSNVCKLACCPDVFIQRECLLCLQQWLQNGNDQIGQDKELIYSTLTSFIQFSLDMEAHLMTLKIWQCIAENLFSEDVNLKSYMAKLCNIGYGFSVLSSLRNLDNSVRAESINSLLHLRKILSDHGFDEMSLTAEELVAVENLSGQVGENSEAQSPEQLLGTVRSTIEERDAAISDILDLGTAGQIYNIMRPIESVNGHDISHDFYSERSKSTVCSKTEFWKTLWSQEILDMLALCKKSSDIYANDPCALLDDIIASRVSCDDAITVLYQQPDCY